jgi:hypothetical protein
MGIKLWPMEAVQPAGCVSTHGPTALKLTRDAIPPLFTSWLWGAFPSAAFVLCDGPKAEISEEFCESSGLVVSV